MNQAAVVCRCKEQQNEKGKGYTPGYAGEGKTLKLPTVCA